MRRTGINPMQRTFSAIFQVAGCKTRILFPYNLNLYPTVIINALLLLDSPSADNA